VDFGALVLPAALVFGAPVSPGSYEKGLFCDSLALVERVVELAERGANPLRVVDDINARLSHTACIYATKADVRARTVRFERNIGANHTTYSIYQVQVTAHGTQKTLIGNIEWTFSPPRTMYTLRAGAPTHTVSH
jgi:hypothetical protein